jgi:hypothetical protein
MQATGSIGQTSSFVTPARHRHSVAGPRDRGAHTPTHQCRHLGPVYVDHRGVEALGSRQCHVLWGMHGRPQLRGHVSTGAGAAAAALPVTLLAFLTQVAHADLVQKALAAHPLH